MFWVFYYGCPKYIGTNAKGDPLALRHAYEHQGTLHDIIRIHICSDDK